MDNNGSRLLTVREFAKEKGISVTTVYMWMRRGLFDDLLKNPGEVFLIPESYLSVTKPEKPKKDKPPRLPRRNRLPPANLEEARERFNRNRSGQRAKSKLSFDEIAESLIDKEMSMQEVAELAGISRQAISLMWNRYFASFLSNGWDRQKKITKNKTLKRAEEHFLSVEKLSRLTEIVTNLGMDVEPILSSQTNSRCLTTKVIINGKLCAIYHLAIPYQVSPRGYRLYYRTNLSRLILSKVDFLIVFVGDSLDRAHIVPAKVILGELSQNGHDLVGIYIPSEKRPIYNNQTSRIDWFSYENNWSQLMETPNDG